MIPTVLAYMVIVIAVPLNWYVVLKLWGLHRSMSDNSVLRDRLIVALALALIVTMFGVIFLNNEMDVPFLDIEATRIITRAAVLALSLPPLYWLWLYRGTGD